MVSFAIPDVCLSTLVPSTISVIISPFCIFDFIAHAVPVLKDLLNDIFKTNADSKVLLPRARLCYWHTHGHMYGAVRERALARTRRTGLINCHMTAAI